MRSILPPASSEAVVTNPLLIVCLMAAGMVIAVSMISLMTVMLRDGFLAVCWGIVFLAVRGEAEHRSLPATGCWLGLSVFVGAMCGWQLVPLFLDGPPSLARILATAGIQVAVWVPLKGLLNYRKRKLAAAGSSIYPWNRIVKAEVR